MNDLIAALVVVVPVMLATLVAAAVVYWTGRVDEGRQADRKRGLDALAAQREYLARPDAAVPYDPSLPTEWRIIYPFKPRVQWPSAQWQRL